MSEINKLRQRLGNVKKNVVEYRMTVAEAKALLAEIDVLLVPPVIEKPAEEDVLSTPYFQIMDGGTF